jgi:hypothetical protein
MLLFFYFIQPWFIKKEDFKFFLFLKFVRTLTLSFFELRKQLFFLITVRKICCQAEKT